MESTTVATLAKETQEAGAIGHLSAQPPSDLLFPDALRWWLDHRGLSQNQFARSISYNAGHVSKVLSGSKTATLAFVEAAEQVLETGGHLHRAAAKSEKVAAAIAARREHTRPAPAQLPISRVHLIGREPHLLKLRARTTRGVGLTVAIDGPPGSGKTALALHYGHSVAHHYRHGQLYADLRGYGPHPPADPAVILADFLRALGVDDVPATIHERITTWRSLTYTRSLLLVLDNVRDAAQIRPLLPGGAGCAVLITSRRRLPSIVADTGAIHITVGQLSRPESIQLLADRIGSRATAERPALARLAAVCGDLPLALQLAGERLALHPQVPLTDLVSELTSGPPWDLLVAPDDPSIAVESALDWSYQALNTDAQRLWRLLGWSGGRATPEHAAVLTGWSTATAQHVLDELILANLAHRTEHIYRLHDLVTAYGGTRAVQRAHSAELRATAGRWIAWWMTRIRRVATLLDPDNHHPDLPWTHWEPPEGTAEPDWTTADQALRWCDTDLRVLLPDVLDRAAAAGLVSECWLMTAGIRDYIALRGETSLWQTCLDIATAACRKHRDEAGLRWLRHARDDQHKATPKRAALSA